MVIALGSYAGDPSSISCSATLALKLGSHHPGQSFPLSLCGPISICRANARMVYGLKHQHFTSHSITTIHS